MKIRKEKLFYHSIFIESKAIDQIEVKPLDNYIIGSQKHSFGI